MLPPGLLEQVEELAVPRGDDAGEAHLGRTLAKAAAFTTGLRTASKRACSMRRARQLARVAIELADRIGAGLMVVLHPPVLRPAVPVEERVGGAVIAVAGHSDAARVDELHPVRAAAPEREVRVAEHDPPRRSRRRAAPRRPAGSGMKLRTSDTGEPWQKSTSSREMRLRQAGELLHQRRAEQLGAAPRARGTTSSGASAAHAVQRSPLPRIQSASSVAEALDRLERPGAGERVVASEQEAVRAPRPRVVEHGLQRGQVAVHVVEQREHTAEATRGLDV